MNSAHRLGSRCENGTIVLSLYVALEAAPGLVVMNDKILEIKRLAELRRLADGGVDHGGALCVGVLLRDDLPRDRPHHLLKHFPPLLS